MKGSAAYPETLNAYGYCWGNPVKYVDRDGKFPWNIVIPIVTIVVVGIVVYVNTHNQDSVTENDLTTESAPTTENVPTAEYVPTTESGSGENKKGISVEDYNIEERKDLIEFIQYSEGGYREKPYDASGDGEVDTIGYGHDFIQNGDSAEWLSKGSITEEAYKLLIQDIQNNIPWDFFEQLENAGVYLKPNEIDAIISLSYNVGPNTLNNKSPEFIELLKKQQYTEEEIISEFLTYGGSNENLGGLRKRRLAEAQIFNQGIYNKNFYNCDLE